MNVNFLGEAMHRRKRGPKTARQLPSPLCKLPEIECVSVKISTLYSQISPIARKATHPRPSRSLGIAHIAPPPKRSSLVPNNKEVTKFVYLDMEEYRDMPLTSQLFMMTLTDQAWKQMRAGIALQAYIPDSFLVQKEITEWAMKRVAAGKSPVTVRIVKRGQYGDGTGGI